MQTSNDGTRRPVRLHFVGLVVVMVALCTGGSWVSAQQDATEQLLAELTNAPGAPGFEGPVRDILKREWNGLLEELQTDGLGNLLGSLSGDAARPRVLLMAHMDEVGFLVRYIDDDGFIFFNPVGGYFDQSVLTQRMTIMTPRGPVVGYTGFKSGHIHPADQRSEMIQQQDMFIDIGRYRDMAAMEDLDLVRRLRRAGRIATVAADAMTSARRWQRDGIWRTTMINQVCILGYRLGICPTRIAAWRNGSVPGGLAHIPPPPGAIAGR